MATTFLLCVACVSLGACIGVVVASILCATKHSDTLDEVTFALEEYKAHPNVENRHLLDLAASEYRRKEGAL